MSRRDIDKIDALVRHIIGVQQNCLLLAERLVEKGETRFAKQLIANGFKHDNSKFYGIEWERLQVDSTDKIGLKQAIKQHTITNQHHPEFWDGGIHEMPKIYLAELVCDWKARSSERGTDLRDWIDTEATVKFKFKKNDAVYDQIKYFVDLLLEPKFEKIDGT